MPNIVNVLFSQTVAQLPATLQQTFALISQGGTITAPGTTTPLTQVSDLTPFLAGAKAITSMTYSGSTVTTTISGGHGLAVGDTEVVTITGVTPAGYNGTYTVTVTSSTVFTYTLATNPGTVTVQGAALNSDVPELLQMANTWFSQGYQVGVYVLELGPGSVNSGVAALSNYLTAFPNINYTAGASGYFYGYIVPREWDGNANFLALLTLYEGLSARTYFHVTTTLSTFTKYDARMKCVKAFMEAPAMGVYAQTAFTAVAWSGGQVTFTAASHNVAAGQWFQVAGVVPAGYNGWYQAVSVTSTTIVAALATNPGTATTMGSLVANYYASTGITSNEFGAAAQAYQTAVKNPSATNKATPEAFSFIYGITPFPNKGMNALLTTLKNANINIVLTGAEGGISGDVLYWGVTMDGNDGLYWYAADWVAINADLNVANEVINGSNNPINPLYYDQPGINRIQARLAQLLSNGVTFGLILGQVVQTALDGPELSSKIADGDFVGQTVCNAVPFLTYSKENPSDYGTGTYSGLSSSFVPKRGFTRINININVTNLVAS